ISSSARRVTAVAVSTPSCWATEAGFGPGKKTPPPPAPPPGGPGFRAARAGPPPPSHRPPGPAFPGPGPPAGGGGGRGGRRVGARENGGGSGLSADHFAAAALSRLAADAMPRLQLIFNLTGTVLHTNLGRALLAEPAVTAATRAMREYVSLEFDVARGRRGERDD